MFVSIFGGMLLTVLVFGLAKKFRLSHFWAAVVAAGLPSFIYAGYALASWPGLDVVTMHLVAYPTVALLLFQMGGTQDGKKLHWAPKLLIGFFVLLTLVMGGFVYIAAKGVPPSVAEWLLPNIKGKSVHTGFAGVVVHGEEASKSIAYQRSLDSKLSKLGWRVEVFGLNGMKNGAPSELKVMIHDKNGLPVTGVRVGIAFVRPGQSAHEQSWFKNADDGSYLVEARLSDLGEWLAVLTLERGVDRIVLERALNDV